MPKVNALEEARLARAERHKAEARLATAQAREVEAHAKSAKLSLERDQEKREKELLADERFRIYSFDKQVGEQSVKSCMNELWRWHREDPKKPITIVFDSPGGDVFDGFALYDTIREIRRRGTRIDTESVGMAASMGGVLLQAGEKRRMGRRGYMLIHEITEAKLFSVEKASETEDRLKFVQKLQDTIVAILAERSTLTAKQIQKRWKKLDWWLDANEALEYGFVDEVGAI